MAYRVAKLKRDHPAVVARLVTGEFKSVRAAERAAGVMPDRRLSKLDKAFKPVIAAWAEASADQRAAFQEAIQELDRDLDQNRPGDEAIRPVADVPVVSSKARTLSVPGARSLR